jgi:hypothetical protein
MSNYAPIYAENNGGGAPREQVPAGMHLARCYEMIQIGTETSIWEGQTKSAMKVRIGFELPEELRTFKEENGEQPMVISREFTLSMHEKSTLRAFLESWRGQKFTEEEAKKFDITKLMGVPCQLNVTHVEKGEKTYANIQGATPLHKSMVAAMPAPMNKVRVLSYSDFDWSVFETLPDFLKTKMANTPEYGSLKSAKEAQERANALKTHGSTVQLDEVENDLPF